MLKNPLFNPTIFGPEDGSRRQALNTLFIFLTATFIWVMIQVFINLANDYSVLTFFVLAFICCIGMNVAHRIVLDTRRQAASLEVVLNNIADGVLVLDQHGNFLSANPALLKMIPEGELREMNSRLFEKSMRWKRKVFAVTTAPIPGVGKLVIFRDQTRCHEAERARDALLAIASHEFRTPVAVVMNYLEMLLMLTKKKRIDKQAFSEHLTRAIENSRRLQRLVINSLDQAHIQAGLLDFTQERFNLRCLLEKSSRFLDVSLKDKAVSYELSIAPDVPVEILADPERLYQVLVNLIGNAVKFTDRGSIKVRVFMSMERTLSIEVMDTGPGIPEEQLPDIFEAFRRASNYAQREHQGAGLGLSIAKEIVTLMGGETCVASTLGVGSIFTISLPLVDTL